MALKTKIQIANLEGTIGAGKTVTAVFPRGGRVHDVTLKFKNTAAADTSAPAITYIDLVEVVYNSEVIWSVSPAHLDKIQTAENASMASQAYTGASNGQGERHLRLFFADPTQDADNGQGVSDRELMALPTDMLPEGGELRIKVTFSNSGTPDLTVNGTVDDVKVGAFQPVRKITTHDFGVSAATKQLVNQFPRTGQYSQFSFFDTSDSKTVEAVKLTLGNVIRYDLSKNEQTTDLKANLMNPASGAFHVVFDANNGIRDTVSLNQGDAKFDLTFSAAASGSMAVVAQRFELPVAA